LAKPGLSPIDRGAGEAKPLGEATLISNVVKPRQDRGDRK